MDLAACVRSAVSKKNQALALLRSVSSPKVEGGCKTYFCVSVFGEPSLLHFLYTIIFLICPLPPNLNKVWGQGQAEGWTYLAKIFIKFFLIILPLFFIRIVRNKKLAHYKNAY